MSTFNDVRHTLSQSMSFYTVNDRMVDQQLILVNVENIERTKIKIKAKACVISKTSNMKYIFELDLFFFIYTLTSILLGCGACISK